MKLFRELKEERVLSVYLDGWSGDFSELNLWRRRFEHEVSDVRDRLSDRESDEVRAFEAAVGEVASALEAYERFLPDQGWVGFATSDRLVYGEPVRVPMPNLVRWEFGIRVAPYVRALKQDRLVVAVLAGFASGSRLRVSRRRYQRVDGPSGRDLSRRVIVTRLAPLSDHPPRGSDRHDDIEEGEGTAQASAGELEAMARSASSRFGSERMLKELVRFVADRAGPQGLLVVGGTAKAISGAAQHLPANMAGRTIQRPAMNFDMSDAEVRDSLEAAASDLNKKIQEDLLSEVVDQARSGGRSALGSETVEQALSDGKVDTLLLSSDFIGANPDYADYLVGVAFEHGEEVEELSLDGATWLDSAGRGKPSTCVYRGR